jgi:endonuclease YncB( thermonuclease family)
MSVLQAKEKKIKFFKQKQVNPCGNCSSIRSRQKAYKFILCVKFQENKRYQINAKIM